MLGISPDEPHDSCTANLHSALGALGLRLTPGDPAFFLTPAPINLWMSTAPLHGAKSQPPLPAAAAAASSANNGSNELWGLPDPRQRPGDYVVWRAEADLVVVLSACPASDVSGVNGPGGRSHDVHVRVLPPLPLQAEGGAA